MNLIGAFFISKSSIVAYKLTINIHLQIKMFKSSQYISTIISYFLLQGLSASTVYVKLPKLGGINGYYQKSANGRQVSAFEGIPYAQPPVGELRFQVHF